MSKNWSGAYNADGKLTVANWTDAHGAHIGLYANARSGGPCDVALTVTPDHQVLFQLVTDGNVKVYDVRKLIAAIEKLPSEATLSGFACASTTPASVPENTDIG